MQEAFGGGHVLNVLLHLSVCVVIIGACVGVGCGIVWLTRELGW